MKINAIIYFKTLFKNPDKEHMICRHGYKTMECKNLEVITIDIDPKNFLQLTEDDTKKEFIRVIENKCNEYIKNKYEIGTDYNQLYKQFKEVFLPEYNKLVLEEKAHTIYLLCYSEHGERDWYGDFNYLSNPLSKYVVCTKQCETNTLSGSGHGYGVAGYIVKTSKDFIELMGWEDDLKYEITREEYIKHKK